MTPETHTNRLARESSPYLLQHAHNPVDWYPWGEEAFEAARRENKPILLSVGYSACHWCHVMERESFENESIAVLMNTHFINIKVDREERPDVDSIYMNAVQLLTGQGGWPMTVFLTPDARPFYGGTYFPPDDRYGRPGFPRLLLSVAHAWKHDRESLEERTMDLLAHLVRHADLTNGLDERVLSHSILEKAFDSLRYIFDARHGGFGTAPKFPQPAVIDLLLRHHARTQSVESLEMAERTLEHMALGGICDQLGGGFHRYSTDAVWLVPHFEKMLYDNAQLAQTYARAFQATGKPLYRAVAEETLEYVLREMTDAHGGFYSAQDADSEGEEGRFFVWTLEEIRSVLGEPDASVFSAIFDVTPQGNWEGHSILRVVDNNRAIAAQFGLDPVQTSALVESCRTRLFAFRESRTHPALDDKVLTAWNGLMLSAMAECAAVFDRDDLRAAAVRNANFVLSDLSFTDGEGRMRLFRTWRRGTAKLNAYLDDYALFSDGLLHLYEATFDPRWLNAAASLVESMIELFWDSDGGGFYSVAVDSEPLIQRPKAWDDNATPGGNSVAAEVLLRLASLTENDDYRQRAELALSRIAALAEGQPYSFARMLGAIDLYLSGPTEIALLGDLGDEATRALVREIYGPYLPNKVVVHAGAAAEAMPPVPWLDGRTARDGKATVYVCRDRVCTEPVTTPQALRSVLAPKR